MNNVLFDKLVSDLTPETIPTLYKDLSDTIGVKNLCNLALQYGGTKIYIPKREHIIRNVRDEAIKREFDGCNYLHLAQKYNLSDTRIREIVKIKKEKD